MSNETLFCCWCGRAVTLLAMPIALPVEHIDGARTIWHVDCAQQVLAVIRPEAVPGCVWEARYQMTLAQFDIVMNNIQPRIEALESYIHGR